MSGILFPYLAPQRTKRFSVVSANAAYAHLTAPEGEKRLVHLDLNCDYTRAVAERALHRRTLWCSVVEPGLVDTLNDSDEADAAHAEGVMQIADFENIRWEMVMRGRGRHRASSYLVRKGLSRKAQLSLQIRRYTCKHLDSVLCAAVPYTLVVETWAAFEELRFFGASFDLGPMQAPLRERLELCLDDVREAVQDGQRAAWRWILKPSVTNKGADIALCGCWAAVLDALEEKEDVREWVLQRYIERPMLCNGHKFHLRVYVLCVGALRVFVFDQILMLLAAHPYDAADIADVHKHLTNTARSAEDINFKEELFVRVLDDLPFYMRQEYPHMLCGQTPQQFLGDVRGQVHRITGELFRAFENEYTVFAPMPNCFELYGLDFMVDETQQVHLLEVNPGPDFKQTGGRLQGLIEQLLEQTLRIVVDDADGRLGAGEAYGHAGGDFSLVYAREASINHLGGGMRLTE